MQHLLKTTLTFAALTILLGGTSGCAYAHNRLRDAGDIFDAAVTEGLGVTTQVSALHTGLGANRNLVGITDGSLATNQDDESVDAALLIYNGSASAKNADVVARNKQYASFYVLYVLPYSGWTSGSSQEFVKSPHYWSKIDVSASVGVGLKIGFNPGELVDFLAGIVGLDLYDDDIHPRASTQPDAAKP